MKKIYYIILAVAAFAASCKKMDTDNVAVNITLPKTTYKVGDTVKFSMSGNADYIDFYSGEPGHNYDLKDVYTSQVSGNPEFQFASTVQSGNATTKGLYILASNNFNGIYDKTNIAQATWTDITNRATLATSTTSVSSGIINVNDLKVDGKPLYIAFRYVSVNPAISNQWLWTISTFQFRTKFANNVTYTNAADNVSAGFGSIEFAGDSAHWSAGTSLVHAGLKAGYPADDDWAITRPFYLNSINSDAAGVVVVKNITSVPLAPVFNYQFVAPGTYNVVFVARNANINSSKQKIFTFTITVAP